MIGYDDNLWILFQIKGSVIPQSILRALPTMVFAIVLEVLEDNFPNFSVDIGMEKINHGFLWSAMTAVISILIGFRSNQALGRFWEGTSLLHQMRGEWFDAASCLVSFSRECIVNNHKVREAMEFRHTLIRLMSLMHASALDEITDNDRECFAVLDIHGLDIDTLKFLRDCKARYNFSTVETLQHLVQVLVTHNYHLGVLTIPPPILSRVYQTLSRGLVNLLNARKIKDTMFPFPFVQTLMWLLFLHGIFTPFVMSNMLTGKVAAATFSFLPIFGLHCLNATSWQLEMPFGRDANDLPLEHFQCEMNDVLLMLIHDGSDRLPCMSEAAVTSFEGLRLFTMDRSKQSADQGESVNTEGSNQNAFSCLNSDANRLAVEAAAMPKSKTAQSNTSTRRVSAVSNTSILHLPSDHFSQKGSKLPHTEELPSPRESSRTESKGSQPQGAGLFPKSESEHSSTAPQSLEQSPRKAASQQSPRPVPLDMESPCWEHVQVVPGVHQLSPRPVVPPRGVALESLAVSQVQRDGPTTFQVPDEYEEIRHHVSSTSPIDTDSLLRDAGHEESLHRSDNAGMLEASDTGNAHVLPMHIYRVVETDDPLFRSATPSGGRVRI